MGESSHQLKMRHKMEIKALKASSKGKKKGGGSALKQLEEDLLKKHAEELAAPVAAAESTDTDALAKDLEAKCATAEQQPPAAQPEDDRGASKKGKAARKKAAKAAREAERKREIEAEVAQMADPRTEENLLMANRLGGLGKEVKDIEADGHCLYRSIGHQLELQHRTQAEAPALESPAYVSLRAMTSQFMANNSADFAAFITDEDGEMLDANGYINYCNKITSANEVIWGGQPEVLAMARALQRPITIHSADGPPLTMGEHEQGGPLHVSYHRFYYGLGEHYNSVIAVPKA